MKGTQQGNTWTASAPRELGERDLHELASLARVELTQGEAQELADRLNGVLAQYGPELSSADTAGVEPYAPGGSVRLDDQPHEEFQGAGTDIPDGATIRADVVRPSMPVEELRRLVRMNGEGLIVVPRMIDEI